MAKEKSRTVKKETADTGKKRKWGLSYIMYCSRKFSSGNRYGTVIIDIRSDYVLGLLEGLDFGEECQITFTTGEGKSIGRNNLIDISGLDIPSIGQQMAFANQLGKEAAVLQKNMEELESAITTFRLE